MQVHMCSRPSLNLFEMLTCKHGLLGNLTFLQIYYNTLCTYLKRFFNCCVYSYGWALYFGLLKFKGMHVSSQKILINISTTYQCLLGLLMKLCNQSWMQDLISLSLLKNEALSKCLHCSC